MSRCEIPMLFDDGDFDAIRILVRRLRRSVIHCVSVEGVIGGAIEINESEYRSEIMLTTLWADHLMAQAGRPNPDALTADTVRAVFGTQMEDEGATRVCKQWLLIPGADRGGDVYQMAMGRVLADCAWQEVRLYHFAPITKIHDPEHTARLTGMVKRMAKLCTWGRTGDESLFQRTRVLLDVERLARLQHGATPMGAIADQLDYDGTTAVVVPLTDTNVAAAINAAAYADMWDMNMFMYTVSVLQEVLDMKIPFYCNTEIPHNGATPGFIAITSNFLIHGTQFGFVWNNTIHFPPPTTGHPIISVVLSWLDSVIENVPKSETAYALSEAIVDPEATSLPTHKMHKFVG